MRYILILLMLLAVGYATADYRWSQDFEECADFKLELFFNGDSIDQICDLDSGATGFDTLLNVDSIGRGLFQFKAKYRYSNSDNMISASQDYNNSRGQAEAASGMTLYVYDTIVPAAVSHAIMSFYTSGGQWLQSLETNTSGYEIFTGQDSGTYTVKTYAAGYSISDQSYTIPQGGGLDTVYAQKVTDPAPAASVNYVKAYIDEATNEVDTSGNIVTLDDLEARVVLTGSIGSTPLRFTDNSYGLIPRVYTATSNGNGRYMFRLPANTVIYPAGTYYELSFKKKGAWAFSRDEPLKFRLDTIPDPINILEAEIVQ